jgi:hypothetical protein
MNITALTLVRRLYNVDYAPRSVNRHNQRAWVKAIRTVGSKWLLATTINKKGNGHA